MTTRQLTTARQLAARQLTTTRTLLGAIALACAVGGCATPNSPTAKSPTANTARDPTCLTSTGSRIPSNGTDCTGIGRSYSQTQLDQTGKTTAAGGVGVAVGVSLAFNEITNGTTAGMGAVQAYLSNTSVDGTGVLTVTALSNQTISATTVAGSAAIAGGGAAGVGVSGAGASVYNIVSLAIAAYISGGSSVVTGGVAVSATDTSAISSTVGAAFVRPGAAVMCVGQCSSTTAIFGTSEPVRRPPPRPSPSAVRCASSRMRTY